MRTEADPKAPKGERQEFDRVPMSSSKKPRKTHAEPAPGRHRTKSLYLVLAAGIVVFALSAAALHYYLRPTVFRIAVGPSGSDDQKLIQAMASTFAQERSSVRLEITTTAGALESIAAFERREVDLAVARGDLKMPRDAEMVAVVRKDFAVLWSPIAGGKKSKSALVKAIDELEGRQIGVIGRTSANVSLLRVILVASGVDPEKVPVKQFSTNQIEDMASDISLSAFIAVGPISSQITSSAIAATARIRGQPKFLPVDVSEAIAQKDAVYESEEIAGSSFNAKPAWPEDKVETISVSHLIVARKTLSESKVATLTKQILTNRRAFSRDLPSATQLKKPDTDKDAALPVHRGAAAYVDNNERSFLDGYSDYIWFAILALSGVGSAFAWLRKFLARDEWDGAAALGERIIAITERARRAGAPRELALLEGEIDDLITETVTCYNDDLLEEQDLSVLDLLLQRFYHIDAVQRASFVAGADGEARLRAI